MASDIFRCVGIASSGKRCKKTAVLPVGYRWYVCPYHQFSPIHYSVKVKTDA